jgi:hypothetical protein
MRWWVAGLFAVALALVPTASAKELTKVVAVGAGGVSVELRGLGWNDLRATAVAASPEGPYVLVYPLMERGIPAQPGRFYPGDHVVCYSWDRSAVGECHQVSQTLETDLNGLPTMVGPPTILKSLKVGRRTKSVNTNGAVAVELAFSRPAVARIAKRPKACTSMQATWTGTEASSRPRRFCSSAKGLWSAGKLYPSGPLVF